MSLGRAWGDIYSSQVSCFVFPERACSSSVTSLVTYAGANAGTCLFPQPLFGCYWCHVARKFCHVRVIIWDFVSFYRQFLGCNSWRGPGERPWVKMSCNAAVLLSVIYIYIYSLHPVLLKIAYFKSAHWQLSIDVHPTELRQREIVDPSRAAP